MGVKKKGFKSQTDHFLQHKDLRKGEELAQGHKVERERSGEEEVKLDPGSPEFPPNTFPPLLGIIFLTCLCSLIFWENKAEAKNSFII